MSPVPRDSCQTRSEHCLRSCPWGSKPDPLQQSWMPWRHAVPNSAVVSGPAPIPGTAGFGRSCRLFSGRICLGLDPWPKREDLACGLPHRPRISGPPLMRPKKPLWRSLARSAGLCPYFAAYLHGVWGLAFFQTLGGAGAWQKATAPLRPRSEKVSDLGFGRSLSLRLLRIQWWSLGVGFNRGHFGTLWLPRLRELSSRRRV